MTFNPEGFADMKDKYFLLNGRSYPDTVNLIRCRRSRLMRPILLAAPAGDHQDHSRSESAAQISDLRRVGIPDTGSLASPMQVIGYNAKLLRDQPATTCTTRPTSITLGGGESLDVIWTPVR